MILTFALSLFLLQSRPAESRPAVQELKPFGDAEVTQPRVAAVAAVHVDSTPGKMHTGVEPPDPSVPLAVHIIGQRGLDVVYTQYDQTDDKLFITPKKLLTVKSGAAMRRGPRIAAFGKRVVVTAPEGGDKDARRILSVVSNDNGKTWSGPAYITDAPGAAAECFHDLAVTAKGEFLVTWLDTRTGKNKGQAIYFSKSSDGVKWEKNRKIYESPNGSVCECCPITIAAGIDGRIAIVFRNSIDGARDLFKAKSVDNGATFSEIQPVDGKTWRLNACPMAEAGLAYETDFGLFANEPVIVNNRDGALTLTFNGIFDPFDLGRGRRPAVADLSGEIFIAYVCENDGQLGMYWSWGEPMSTRKLMIPPRAGGETVDSPALAIGLSHDVWLAFEVRRENKVSSRLVQPWGPSGLAWPVQENK
ncbi:MAG: exo-alpha-sialidase [Planctomycetes bacterium]|nr:exo-alpha-sialidase [Planctomycetota bacterium]